MPFHHRWPRSHAIIKSAGTSSKNTECPPSPAVVSLTDFSIYLDSSIDLGVAFYCKKDAHIGEKYLRFGVCKSAEALEVAKSRLREVKVLG